MKKGFYFKSAIGGVGMSAKSYGSILGANNKIRVGILGFSNRFKGLLGKAFLKYAGDMNFEFFTVCDIWNRRRDEGQAWYKETTGGKINTARNTDELWEQKPDAVIISTADFQHAVHTAEAVCAGADVYCEKPFAETMDDANVGLKAVKGTGRNPLIRKVLPQQQSDYPMPSIARQDDCIELDVASGFYMFKLSGS